MISFQKYFTACLLVLLSPTAFAQSAPPLGAAAPFGVLGGGAGITNQGILTVINGDIGTTGASTLITGFHDGVGPDHTYTETPLNAGFVNGTIFTAPPAPGTVAKLATASQALADARTAFIALSPAAMPGGIDLGTGELGGRTLAPGIYKSAPGTYAITLVDLTLDGQGNANALWVFQMATSLTVGVAGPTGARSVKLINGAQAKNVFWQVGSAATINGAGGGTMVGTIIASAGATFSTAGNVALTALNGRALGLDASVTLVNTIINVPGPASGPGAGSCSDRVTGGGYITTNNGKANFGVTAGIRKDEFRGHLTYIDHGIGLKVKGTRVTAYVVDGRTRHIEGTAKIEGRSGTYTYKVDVTDNGEPGKNNDSFAIMLSNRYSASGRLAGGNIQLHKRDCDKDHHGDGKGDGDEDREDDEHDNDGKDHARTPKPYGSDDKKRK